MANQPEWNKENFHASLSSKCWGCTPYDEGWDNCKAIQEDDELKQIFEMETDLESMPRWASETVLKGIAWLPPCAHYTFPRQYTDIVNAIGSQKPPDFMPGCFKIDRRRKKQMMDYCVCLDAWVSKAVPQGPAAELSVLAQRRIDWHKVCVDMWEVFGERTEQKVLQIQYVLHAMRSAIKWWKWEDDPGTKFGRDQYLGYAGHSCPSLKDIESGLGEDLKQLRYYCFDRGWWCAPRAFRMLECLLWRIGKGQGFKDVMETSDDVPGFLQCDDTYAGQSKHEGWVIALQEELGTWRRERKSGSVTSSEVVRCLGEATPAKQWLARLFAHKLRMTQKYYGEPLRDGW